MKLYKEASLMMLPTSVKDGKLYSIFPQPKPLSGELVTNGTFDEDASWTEGTGWDIIGGKAVCDGTQTTTTYLNQSNAIISPANKKYKIKFTVSDYVSGGVGVYPTINGIGSYALAVANGDYVHYYEAPSSATNTTLYVQANGTFQGSIDNISVVEVDQLPADFTFSRGSNLAATRINEQGLIEKGRENLLLQSNQFDTTWTTNNTDTPTSGHEGYDGSSDAWLLTKTSGFGNLDQVVSSSGVNTISVHLKANTNNWAILEITGVGYAYFDLQNGVIGSGNSVVATSIESVGNGWYRCSYTGNGSGTRGRIYVADSDGNSSSASGSIYIQDAQVEVGLVATDYIESGATTGKAGVLEDLPRLNWGGNCPSLLLEPSRQNLITYSEYLEEADSLADAQILNTTDTTPEGTSNAKVLAYNGGTNQHYLSNVPSVTSGQTYTFSVFLKKKELKYAALIFLNDFRGRFFDLETGSILGTIGSGSLIDSKIEDYGNGWYRCSITDTATSTTKFSGVYLCNSATSFGGVTPTNTDGFYVWGLQLEEGSYATSYIPTHGTSVTRSADETELVSLPNELSGDFSFYLNTEDFSTFNAYLRLNDSNGNYVYAIYSYNNHYDVYNGSSFLVQEDAAANGKLILKREEGTVKIFVNGEDKTKSGAVSNNDTITGIEVQQQTNAKISIKELAVFNTALSDNECINLTSI